MKTHAIKILCAMAVLAIVSVLLNGCTLSTEKTTINTPAVFNVSRDAAGQLQTNLVSPASVTKTIKRDRLWLPEGYALMAEQDIWGINVTPFDPSSANAKVQAGVISTRLRLIPTSTNSLYSPPLTSQAKVNNKAVPFFMSAGGQFTSGDTRSSQSDTNAQSTALIPGTPNDQQK